MPFARWSATLRTPSPRIAHLSRIGVSGIPMSLPAYEPVQIYSVTVEDGIVQVEVVE